MEFFITLSKLCIHHIYTYIYVYMYNLSYIINVNVINLSQTRWVLNSKSF